jgi:hypothetical protein
LFRSRSKTQRSDRQKVDDTIELVKDAQSATKMRFIDPAETKPGKKPPRFVPHMFFMIFF